MSKWNEKRAKAELRKIDKELDSIYGSIDADAIAAADTRAAACGAGEEELFERKLTKEEKKAAAKAAREAKKAAKVRIYMWLSIKGLINVFPGLVHNLSNVKLFTYHSISIIRRHKRNKQ